ncbi:MAG TPA: PLP-dependent aspartate aminotransferase family protein [Terriglobales bacterium]
MKNQKHRPETQAVHAGIPRQHKNGPVMPPIHQTATFEASDNEEQLRVTHTDMFYSRYGNPTLTVVENAISELEGTEGALVFASGMSAITSSILSLVSAGDHIVAQRDIYGGTIKFLTKWLSRFGVETTFVDSTNYSQHEKAIQPNTKILYLESPTNPTLRVIDLKKTAAIAQKHYLISMIDSTFATPINQRPADYGIDLVLHSGTKYYSGHSDLLCGIIAGRKTLIEKIWETRTISGPIMDPHAAWLLLRGIKTLVLRVQRQNETALRVAQFLSDHPNVKQVHYPFLEGHPQRALAMEQLHGGGGVLSFEVNGTSKDACHVSEALQLFTLAPSLGGVESLVSIPVLTSHAMISPEHRQKMGVTDQLIRIAVGIENSDDLIADLKQALEVMKPAAAHVQVG